MTLEIQKRMFGGLVFAMIGTIILPTDCASAAGFKVLYSFTGGSDGRAPAAGVIQDTKRNLYGATSVGGNANQGTVFKLSPKGTLTELNFCAGGPEGTLVRDEKGNLYGTFFSNGGGVFEIHARGTCTILHSFNGSPDGYAPTAGLLSDAVGNLYGTTDAGGTGGSCPGGIGCGTVFKIAPNGQEGVLYSFTGGSDGSYPNSSSLIMDASGNLYGTTVGGGSLGGNCSDSGCGTVFKLAPDGIESVLHSFSPCEQGPPCNDGFSPYGGVIEDSAGNLYGTASEGGTHDLGVVFKLAPDGTETLLHSFNVLDGVDPLAGLTWDNQGNLYGTTAQRGTQDSGGGTIFTISAKGRFKVLHRFLGNDGLEPLDALLADGTGHLFGTTAGGGPDNGGVVFRINE